MTRHSRLLTKTKSAAANEAAVNNKFEELSNQSPTPSGGGSTYLPYGTMTQLEATWVIGYIDANGVTHKQSSDWKMTETRITVQNHAGDFLFVPGYFHKQVADYYICFKYDVNDSLLGVTSYSAWGKHYLVIPITTDAEYYRICMLKSYTAFGDVYVVDKDWLIYNGYADAWAGKKFVMYGDSYVQGQDIEPTWHRIFATRHVAPFTKIGYKGMGLMLNANANMVGTLVTHLESDFKPNGQRLDVDVIGICFGRNDYSKGVPIGNIDDIVTAYSTDNPQSLSAYTCYDREAKSTDTEQDHPNVIQATFCGGLNYLCKWLLTEYPDKRIFFVTPWYFLDDNPAGQATTAPVAYVDAVKTIAGKWGIPCFDAARQSGISVQSYAFRDMFFKKNDNNQPYDTSHLNLAGHRRMATGPVAGWLENLFRD